MYYFLFPSQLENYIAQVFWASVVSPIDIWKMADPTMFVELGQSLSQSARNDSSIRLS